MEKRGKKALIPLKVKKKQPKSVKETQIIYYYRNFFDKPNHEKLANKSSIARVLQRCFQKTRTKCFVKKTFISFTMHR